MRIASTSDSAEPWPSFGVPPAYLTPRGRMLMRRMGAYYGAWLSGEGLLDGRTCAHAPQVYIWADTDQRTVETGRALAEGLLPRCSIPVHMFEGSGADPLFDPIEAGVSKPDPALGAKAVRERIGRDFTARHRGEFQELHQILTGGGAARRTPYASPEDIGVTVSGESVEVTGPLRTATTLTENLLLAYANGFEGRELGWGRLNARNLQQVLELHTAYADLMRRTPYLARARGGNLLTRVRQSIAQAVAGKVTADALGTVGDRLLIVSGHDTNLSNISGMLDLSWHLPGYPADDTPPGGAIVFSLWREPSGQYAVRTQYLAETPDQMRTASDSAAAAPVVRDVALPACGPLPPGALCPWERFERVLRDAVR